MFSLESNNNTDVVFIVCSRTLSFTALGVWCVIFDIYCEIGMNILKFLKYQKKSLRQSVLQFPPLYVRT